MSEEGAEGAVRSVPKARGISTEEAQRIADDLPDGPAWHQNYPGIAVQIDAARDALRSLAAERDAKDEEIERLRDALEEITEPAAWPINDRDARHEMRMRAHRVLNPLERARLDQQRGAVTMNPVLDPAYCACDQTSARRCRFADIDGGVCYCDCHVSEKAAAHTPTDRDDGCPQCAAGRRDGTHGGPCFHTPTERERP